MYEYTIIAFTRDIFMIKWFRRDDIESVKRFNETVALTNGLKPLPFNNKQELNESLMMIQIWNEKVPNGNLCIEKTVDLLVLSKEILEINMELAGLYTFDTISSKGTLMGKSKQEVSRNVDILILKLRNKYGFTGGTLPEDVLICCLKELGITELLQKYDVLFDMFDISKKPSSLNHVSTFVENVKKLAKTVDVDFELKYDTYTLTNLTYQIERSNFYRLKRASKYVD